MTNLLKNTMFVAAALVFAGAASAQTLKADIPFSFRAAGMDMPAGTYQISAMNTSNGTPIFRVRNEETRTGVLVVPSNPKDPAKEWRSDGQARLAFACGSTHCSLTEIWQGEGSYASYRLATPKHKGEDLRVQVITAQSVKSTD